MITSLEPIHCNKNKVKTTTDLSKTREKKIFTKKSDRDSFKKTFMLILVCSLLLLVELPHSVFLFISVFENYLYVVYYLPLKEFLNFLLMIAYLFNFLIYCFMSKLFRNQFISFYRKY